MREKDFMARCPSSSPFEGGYRELLTAGVHADRFCARVLTALIRVRHRAGHQLKLFGLGKYKLKVVPG